MNVQLLADPAGRLVWASPALPGAAHDVTGSDGRSDRRFDRRQCEDLRGQGLSRRGQHDPDAVQTASSSAPVSRGQRDVNRAHARVRAIGERAVATLKGWKVLTKLRCCPHRATALAQAILVLLVEEGRYSR